jgi:hypothetical protein
MGDMAKAPQFIMAGLDPAIHVLLKAAKTWMPATSAGMTAQCLFSRAWLLRFTV